jgi:hypothetical protein
MAQVHGGPRQCGQEGMVAPCRRAGARSHRCSPVAVERGEPDEAVLEACSPEHERRQRGGAIAKKTGGGLSSLQQ